jgi:DNA-binding winged helix-turn-helix (wHTH) protein/tetratricopeptide (TPR) repeat protein
MMKLRWILPIAQRFARSPPVRHTDHRPGWSSRSAPCYFSLRIVDALASRANRMSSLENLVYRFGEFELEPRERRLVGSGGAITLTPKVFDTLVLLVESAGHVLKKDELMKALWPRGYVDEATLSNHVWQIRRALGDTARNTRFIETVPKLGYRFAAPVAVSRSPTPPVIRRRLVRWRGLIIAGSALLLAVLLAWQFGPFPGRGSARAVSDRAVALVGFTNLSQIANDAWLAPALAAMLGSELGAADEIRIVPYALVRDATKDLEAPVAGGYPREVLAHLRKQLDVDYVVSGSYLVGTAPEDPTLRVDVSVQDARTGVLIASVTNQVGLSALSLLVTQMGSTLRGKLGVVRPNAEILGLVATAQPPTTEVAHHMGLALDALARYDAAHARDELIEAIAQAPGYAPAHLYLARAWSALGYRQKALAAAEQASTRAGTLPPDQRLQVDAEIHGARYEWREAAASWKALVDLKPLMLEHRIAWIDAELAAGELLVAQAALAELLRLPQAADDPRVQLCAARVADARSDAKASAAHSTIALRQAQLREEPGLIADAQVELAAANNHLGEHEAAKSELADAITGYRALGNPHGESEARRALAAVLDDLHRGPAAREQYQLAMSIAQRIGDMGGVAAVYRNLCEVLWTAGDRDAAAAAAQRALEISRETGDLRLQAWTLRALATIASDEAASDEVMSEYREVTVLTERSHDPGGHVWSLATNADVLRLRGELDEAQDNCVRARAEAKMLSDPQFSIYSEFTCALVAIDRGETDSARVALDKVARLSQSSGNIVYGPNAELVLAQLDYEKGDWVQARARLRRAIQGFAAGELETGEADAQAMLALCAQASGDVAERDQAAARANTLRERITARQEIFFVEIALAQLANSPRRGADAIVRLRDLAADAERRQWLSWSLEAKLAEWQLLKAAGNPAAATHLRADLESAAGKRGFRRILTLMSAAPPQKAI